MEREIEHLVCAANLQGSRETWRVYEEYAGAQDRGRVDELG